MQITPEKRKKIDAEMEIAFSAVWITRAADMSREKNHGLEMKGDEKETRIQNEKKRVLLPIDDPGMCLTHVHRASNISVNIEGPADTRHAYGI